LPREYPTNPDEQSQVRGEGAEGRRGQVRSEEEAGAEVPSRGIDLFFPLLPCPSAPLLVRIVNYRFRDTIFVVSFPLKEK
jgi:hypothetical protein